MSRPDKRYANTDHIYDLSDILSNESINDFLFDVELFTINVITSEYGELIEYLIFQIFLSTYSEKFKKHCDYKKCTIYDN